MPRKWFIKHLKILIWYVSWIVEAILWNQVKILICVPPLFHPKINGVLLFFCMRCYFLWFHFFWFCFRAKVPYYFSILWLSIFFIKVAEFYSKINKRDAVPPVGSRRQRLSPMRLGSNGGLGPEPGWVLVVSRLFLPVLLQGGGGELWLPEVFFYWLFPACATWSATWACLIYCSRKLGVENKIKGINFPFYSDLFSLYRNP